MCGYPKDDIKIVHFPSAETMRISWFRLLFILEEPKPLHTSYAKKKKSSYNRKNPFPKI